MVVNKGFCLKLCSDLDFEGMVVDVCFNDQTIAMINYDKGVENIEIKIVSGEQSNMASFSLQGYMDALDQAKQLAIQCAKEDAQRNQSDIDQNET